MDREVLVHLKKAFEHLESKAASNQELNCGDWIMIGMAIDLICNEIAKPDDAGVLNEFWEKSSVRLLKVHVAINQYYLALDRREHGGLAQDRAFNEIQQVLGMRWQQGEMLKKAESDNK